MKLRYKIIMVFSISLLISILGLYSHLNAYNSGFIKGKDYVIENTLIKGKKAIYSVNATCGGG